MRISENRLRSIIRSVIKESINSGSIVYDDDFDAMIIEKDRDLFNKKYGNLLLDTGSDYYEIDSDYVNRLRMYEKLARACQKGYTSYGNIDEKRAADIFNMIGCNCRYFTGDWFVNNAISVINCLENASVEKRKLFFNQIDGLLS